LQNNVGDLGSVLEQDYIDGKTGWRALVRPLFVASVAFLCATTTGRMGGWEIGPTTILALVAFIDGLFLTAYVQSKYS
jgi:hypothetical protein